MDAQDQQLDGIASMPVKNPILIYEFVYFDLHLLPMEFATK